MVLKTQYWPLGFARVFLFWFSRGDCFLERACGREFCRPPLVLSCKLFWEYLWHGKVYLNISELSAENGVAVLNAYGSIIEDNKDHVDDSITEVCWYLRHQGGNILSWVWNSKSWYDLFCLLISILIDPIHFGIERTATVKVYVFLCGGLIGVTFVAEQLRFEPTAGVELSNVSKEEHL